MRDVYVICMIIGFSLLLLSVLGDFLGSVTDALEGALNMDFDADLDLDLVFLPMSGVSICAGLIVFGGLGLLTGHGVAAAVCAYITAMVIQSGIRRLKRVKNEAMSRDELYLCDGRIINTVLPGGLGTVEFNNIKGMSATFVCKAQDPNAKLRQNTEVKLVDFEGEVAVVKLKDEFLEYEDSSGE